MNDFDFCVIGAGVIGLACCYQITQRFPNSSILLLEQEARIGSITSSRNSEVIHAGIYYPQNSLKALMCLEGKEMLYSFCQQFNVPHKQIQKLIVAPADQAIPSLEAIQSKADRNNAAVEWLDESQCKQLEPHVQAKAALLSPSTGIIDSHHYMQQLLTLSEPQTTLACHHKVSAITQTANGFSITGTDSESQAFKISTDVVINSAGLHAQEVAHTIEGIRTPSIPELHLCRGHYFSYSGQAPFNHLIYPTIEPNAAGLGVHATLDLAGQVKFGPDTQYIQNIDYQIPNQEILKESFYQAIKSYFPSVEKERLQPSYSGIRPKLQAKGEDVKDFIISSHHEHGVENLINLYGIESPGLTASLAIGKYVAKQL